MSSENFEQIKTEMRGNIKVITMSRPERLNAWTRQMSNEMHAAIEAGNAAPEVEGFVLTGEGRGFCAGADIKDVFKSQADSGEVREGSNEPGDWVGLLRSSKPFVAAVNGASIGVGLTQILPMDYIVASEEAKLSCRFIKMGLVPELGSSQYLVTRCGFGQASELMLSGKTVSAAEAKDIGLVDKVVPHDELLDAACEIAQSMGENPQSAIKMVKQLISENLADADIRRVQQREIDALIQCYASAEHKEAIQAFIEKRDPDFRSVRERESG